MSEVATIIPHQFATLLRPPAFCVGEDSAEFDRLRDVLLDDIKPVTPIEYLLTHDIIVAEWELLRLHRFKAGMLNAHMLELLKDRGWPYKYHQKNPFLPVLRLFRSTLAGDPEARKKLEKYLAKYRLYLSDVAATAFEKNIGAQAQSDHLINAALKRRETAYAELERRRTNARNQSVIEAQQRIGSPVIDGEIVPSQ
jgi:hypothetical protein